MAQQPVKNLYFAHSLGELQKKAGLPNLGNSPVKTILTSADKLLNEAEKYFLSGDEELSYFFYYRYMDAIAQAQKNEHYIKNKSFFENLAPKHCIENAVRKLELLTDSLENRYLFQNVAASTAAATKRFVAKIENNRRRLLIRGNQTDQHQNVIEMEPIQIEIGVDALAELGEGKKGTQNKEMEAKIAEKELMKKILRELKTKKYEEKLGIANESKPDSKYSPATSKKEDAIIQQQIEAIKQTLLVPPLPCPSPRKVLKVYLVHNWKVFLDFSPFIRYPPSSSPPIKGKLIRLVFTIPNSSQEASNFCEILKKSSELGKILPSNLFVTFHINNFNRETKLLSMSIRVDGPFVIQLLSQFKKSWKVTFRMKLYGKKEDLYCQDTVMRILKNEKGENALFGIDVGLIALDEWLTDSSLQFGKVSIQLLEM